MKFRKAVEQARALARAGRKRDAVLWFVMTVLRMPMKVTAVIGGRKVKLRPGSPDAQVALSCLSGEFDELVKAIPELKYPLIVDAGGYIGTAAIVFAESYPHATVVTLEPSRESFAVLEQNVAKYKNIVPMNKALTPAAGRINLRNRGTGQWGFTVVQQPVDNAASEIIEEVECTTLEEIRRSTGNQGIGILKLDIEGGEHALLDDGASWMNDTQAICIELHDRIVAGCSDAFFRASAGRRNTKMQGEKYLSIATD